VNNVPEIDQSTLNMDELNPGSMLHVTGYTDSGDWVHIRLVRLERETQLFRIIPGFGLVREKMDDECPKSQYHFIHLHNDTFKEVQVCQNLIVGQRFNDGVQWLSVSTFFFES